MKNLNIIDHPLIHHYLSRMRNAETAEFEFRLRLTQICHLMLFSITKDLPVKLCQIPTPLETAAFKVLDCDLVVVSILRAGLGMQEALMELLPDAKVGHLGFFRNEETLQPVEYYAKLPKNLQTSIVLLADPMLATGGSMNASLDLLKEHGAQTIKCVTLLAAPEGVEAVQKQHPDVEIFMAALDRQLNDRGYILPGLGDAGDRQFGTE